MYYYCTYVLYSLGVPWFSCMDAKVIVLKVNSVHMYEYRKIRYPTSFVYTLIIIGQGQVLFGSMLSSVLLSRCPSKPLSYYPAVLLSHWLFLALLLSRCSTLSLSLYPAVLYSTLAYYPEIMLFRCPIIPLSWYSAVLLFRCPIIPLSYYSAVL